MKRGIWIWFSLIPILLLFSLAVKIGIAFKKSFVNRFSRISFVVATAKPQVFVLTMEGNEGRILIFSGKEKVTTTRGFGEYELGKIYSLGELEGKGGFLLKESIERYLHAALFGYFYDQLSFDYPLSKPKNFFTQTVRRALLRKSETNIGKPDLLLLYFKARRLNELNLEIRNFGPSDNEAFKDKVIREEALSLQILNATDHFGLAQDVSLFLERAGARVVRVADADEGRKTCLIKAIEEVKESYTLSWLRYVFGCQVVSEKEDEERAQITMIVGEEYWKRLHEKW